MSSIADSLHVKQTEKFIAGASSRIVFRRAIKEGDPSGGQRTVGHSDRDAQEVRVVGLRSPRVIVTNEGRTVIVDKVVVGLPDLDVEVGDLFQHGGQNYEVTNVSREPGWRTQAEVSSRA